MQYPPKQKPTRSRFVEDVRLGFRGKKKVVEVVKFKEVKEIRKIKRRKK